MIRARNIDVEDLLRKKSGSDGKMRQTKDDRRYIYDTFGSDPELSASDPATGAAVSGTTDRLVRSAYNSFRFSPCGTTQTLLAPLKTAGGWNITHDLTDNDIIEMYPSGALQTDCGNNFVVGAESCFLRVTLTLADETGSDLLMVGFRKVEASNGTFTSYTDYAAIGNVSGDIKTMTEVNGGGTTTTDTTQNWAAAEAHTLCVKVAPSGAVTYEIDGARPTTVAAFTFDSGDRIMPFLYLRHDTGVSENTRISLWESGLQPSSVVTLL